MFCFVFLFSLSMFVLRYPSTHLILMETPEVLASAVTNRPFHSLCLVTVCLLIVFFSLSPCLWDTLPALLTVPGQRPHRCVLETSTRACPPSPASHFRSSASSSFAHFLHAFYDFPLTLVFWLGLLRLLASLTKSSCHFLIFLICIFISIGSIILSWGAVRTSL